MIVVDTSIWVDHARQPMPELVVLLAAGNARIHEFVVGELLLGTPGDREACARFLDGIPRVVAASGGFVRTFVEAASLCGTGIGYVDAHLLASTLLIVSSSLWNHDMRLGAVADRIGIRAGIK